jgi:hypothetical protein
MQRLPRECWAPYCCLQANVQLLGSRNRLGVCLLLHRMHQVLK